MKTPLDKTTRSINQFMKDKKRKTSALVALFPDVDTLAEFLNDNDDSDRIDSIIRFAVKNEIIDEPDINLLRAFIEKRCGKSKGVTEISEISFGMLIEKRKQILGIDDSMRNITKSINTFISSSGLFLPPVNHSMFTRLKNEPIDTSHKRDAIRCFSFWLGYHFPDSVDHWNFRNLVQLGKKKEVAAQIKDTTISSTEGVRISFAVDGLGENVSKAFEWLKKQIHETISYLALDHIKSKQIVSLFPTIHVDIHKKSGPAGEPRHYDQALRDAMALSHQIAIKSSLYFGGDRDKKLAIAIAAGEYLRLEPLVQALLSARFQQTAMIRVSHFARVCARISDIKVIFFENEEKIIMPNGQTISAWFVKCFWTTVYYDFVPDLLNPEMLPDATNPEMVKNFVNALHFQIHEFPFKALQILYQSPQNDMLVLEVAKTLTGKGLHQEANTVLSSVLSNDPYHLVARCLRTILFLNMALNQKTIQGFEEYFHRAKAECRLIMNFNNIIEPEVFCETGLVYLWGALQYFVFIRNEADQSLEPVSDSRYLDFYNLIRELLDVAQNHFEQGTVISPSGADNRCIYWYVYSKAIKELIESDPDVIRNTMPVKDKNKVFFKTGEAIFLLNGWRDERFGDDYFFSRFWEGIRKYQNSVLYRSYAPNVYYSIATIVFDFRPVLSVGILKMVLSWLQTAKDLSIKLESDHAVKYVTSCFGKIMPTKEFILFVEYAIHHIENKASHLLKEADEVEIDMDIFEGTKLLMLIFERDNNSYIKII